MNGIGSRDDLEAFLTTRRDALLRFGYVLTGNPAVAEDLVQSALVEVFKRWRNVNPAGAEAYTRRAMTRSAWRLARRRRETVAIDRVESQPAAQSDSEGALDLRTAVRRLSRDKRTIIVLRYWLGYTDAQIADALGCSIGTVKSRGYRAMTELKCHLGAPIPASRSNHAHAPHDAADPAATDRSQRP